MALTLISTQTGYIWTAVEGEWSGFYGCWACAVIVWFTSKYQGEASKEFIGSKRIYNPSHLYTPWTRAWADQCWSIEVIRQPLRGLQPAIERKRTFRLRQSFVWNIQILVRILLLLFSCHNMSWSLYPICIKCVNFYTLFDLWHKT